MPPSSLPSLAWVRSTLSRGNAAKDSLVAALEASPLRDRVPDLPRLVSLLFAASRRIPDLESLDDTSALSAFYEELAGHDAPWIPGHLVTGDALSEGAFSLASGWQDELEAQSQESWWRSLRPPAVGLDSGPAGSFFVCRSLPVALTLDEPSGLAAVAFRNGAIAVLHLDRAACLGTHQATVEQRCMTWVRDPQDESVPWLVTGGVDGVIHLWNSETELRAWKAHDGPIDVLSWHAAGRLLSLCRQRCSATVGSLTGRRITTVRADDAALSEDGERLGWSFRDTVSITSVIDVASGATIRTLDVHDVSLPGTLFGEGGRTLFCFAHDGPRLVDLASGAFVSASEAPPRAEGIVDGEHALLYNGQTLVLSMRGKVVERYPTKGAFFPFLSERYLIATSYSPEVAVRIWDRRSGKEQPSIPCKRGFMASRRGLRHGRYLAVAGTKGVLVQDLETGHTRDFPTLPHDIYRLAFSEDGTRLVSSQSAHAMDAWDVSSGTRIYVHGIEKRHARDAWFRPNGELLSLVQDFGVELALLLGGTAKVIQTFPMDNVEMASISSDGQKVAAASRERGRVQVWDAHSGRLLVDTIGDAVSFDDTGARIVVRSRERRAGVRRVNDSLDELVVRRARSSVGTGGFSRDGRRLFTISQDTVRHRDMASKVQAWARSTIDTGPNAFDACLAHEWDVDSRASVACFAVPKGTEHIAAENATSRIVIDAPFQGGAQRIDLATGSIVKLSSSDVSPTTPFRLTRATGGWLEARDAMSGELLARLGHPAEVALSSADTRGKFVVVACQDGSMHVWTLPRPAPRQVIDHAGAIEGIAWSQDKTRIVTWASGECIVWSASTGELLWRIRPRGCDRAALPGDGTTLLVERTWESEISGEHCERERRTVGDDGPSGAFDSEAPWPEQPTSPFVVRAFADRTEVHGGSELVVVLPRRLSFAACHVTPSGIRLAGASGSHFALYELRGPSTKRSSLRKKRLVGSTAEEAEVTSSSSQDL